MSNQVFANNVSRYFPAVDQSDTFTLTKNNPGPPAYGTRSFVLIQAGGAIQFNSLNGNPMTAGAGGWPYGGYQNPSTKPYWTLSSAPNILNNSLVLTANTNNTVMVELVMPCTITGGSIPGGTYPVMVCLMLLNDINSFDTGKVVAMAQKNLVSNSTTVDSLVFSAVVNMYAGQILTPFCFINDTGTAALISQDNTNGLSKILVECSLKFSKV